MVRAWIVLAGLTTVAAADPSPPVALVARGEALWGKSCPTPNSDDLCVARVAARSDSGHCHSDGSLLTATPRVAALAQQAQALFARVVELCPKTETCPEATVEVAQARLRLADHTLEALLALSPPSGLNFSPPDADGKPAVRARQQRRLDGAKARFKAAVDAALRLHKEASDGYGAVAVGSGRRSLRAVERIGRLHEALASWLRRVPVPTVSVPAPGVDEQEWRALFRDGFCEQMAVQSRRLDEKAAQAYEECVTRAQQRSVDEGPCAREAERIRAWLARPVPPAPVRNAAPLEPRQPDHGGAGVFGVDPGTVKQ